MRITFKLITFPGRLINRIEIHDLASFKPQPIAAKFKIVTKQAPDNCQRYPQPETKRCI